MSDPEFDRALRRALLDAAARDAAGALPAPAPSRRHKRAMRAMLRDPLRWAKNRTRPAWQTALARAAAFLLAVLAGLAALTLSIPAARATLLRWYVTWTDPTHLTYRYTGEAPDAPLPHYEITALPDEFAEVERVEHPFVVNIVYEGPDGNMIFLDYNFTFKGSFITYGTENMDVYDIYINGFPGKYMENKTPENVSHVTWIDTDMNIQFSISGTLSRDDILHIAESVSLVKSTN